MHGHEMRLAGSRPDVAYGTLLLQVGSWLLTVSNPHI